MTSLRPHGSYRRTVAGALGGIALVGAQVLGWPVHHAEAQSAPAFVPGTANATAQALQLAPSTGGLDYNATLAETVADYQTTEGQAQSETLDPGAIGLSLTTQQCDGSPPAVQQSQLPQSATAESDSGDSSQTRTVQGANGAAVGSETAEAKTAPSGSSGATLTGLDIPGVLDVSGGNSTAEAQLIDNKTREATGSSELAQVSLLGGQIVIDGSKWQATQRSGDGATQQGAFSVAGLTVSGKSLPVSPGQLAQSLAKANQALAPTGFHITAPAMSNNGGTVVEGPLSIGIDSSALGQQVVAPGLSAAQPIRQAISSALLAINCRFAIPLLLGDIATGPLAGGGGLDINLGGATAASDGTAYANPFDVDLGGGALGLAQGGPGSPAGSGTAGGGLGSAGTAAAGQALAGMAGSPGRGPGSAGQGSAALGPVSNASSRLGVGRALPVGLGALALVLVLASMDYARARRSRMFSSTEPTP